MFNQIYYICSVASLISCLHELQAENKRLEKEVTELASRRDNLLAVNARLKALPSAEASFSSNVPFPAVSLLSSKGVPPNDVHVPSTAAFTGYMSYDNSMVHSTQVRIFQYF